MSGTILQAPGECARRSGEPGEEAKNPFLVALGERARALRSRRGMTRKALALAADVPSATWPTWNTASATPPSSCC